MNKDRLARLVFPRTIEEWREANAEQEAAPREPGRYKMTMGGEPRTAHVTATCSRCRRELRSTGISFGDRPPCDRHDDVDECLVIHIHEAFECPYWRFRLWRVWHHRTWGRVERTWKTRRWRRRARRERSDPEAWKNYWAEGGGDD